MDVYQRIDALTAGDSIFVDLHLTLIAVDSVDKVDSADKVNLPLVNKLIEAQNKGVLVLLWTGGGWHETVKGVTLMLRHGLMFDDIFMNVLKPTGLIIDNLSVSP